MEQDQERIFMGVLLKKGWLSREALRNAVLAVREGRKHDPELTLERYLGLKGLLSWEKIQQAEALAAKYACRSGKKQSGAALRKGPHASASHSSGKYAKASHPGASRRRRARRAERNLPLLILGGVGSAFAVLLLVLLVCLPGRRVESRRPTAPQVERTDSLVSTFRDESKSTPARIAAARAFMETYPGRPEAQEARAVLARLDSLSEVAWKRAQGNIAVFLDGMKYASAVEFCKRFAEKWAGSKGAQSALERASRIERIWRKAAQSAKAECVLLASQGKIRQAAALLEETLAWCPPDMRDGLEAEFERLKRAGTTKKPVEVALATTNQEEKKPAAATSSNKKAQSEEVVIELDPLEEGPQEEEETPQETSDLPPPPPPENEGPSGKTASEEVKHVEPEDLSAAELFRRARDCAKKERYEEALSYLHRVLNLYPNNRQAQREWARVALKVAKARIKAAREAIAEGNRLKARALLASSYDLVPTAEAVSLFKKLGLYRHRARWMSKEEIAEFEKFDSERGKRRRRELKLDDSYRIVRTDYFRVLTNLPAEKQWDKWLQPHLLHMEALYRTYRRIFVGLLDEKEAFEGLDVVFFKSPNDYETYRRKQGFFNTFRTAGFYTGGLRSSFFYRDPNAPMDKQVLLHELTHQLNNQVLHAAQMGWAEEGLAQYFEIGRLRKDGFLEVGKIHPEKFPELRIAILSKTDYIPAEKIFHAPGVDDPSLRQYKVSNIYAHMWGWVYYFLHSNERNRRMFFEGLRRESRCLTGKAPFKPPPVVYAKLFMDYGITFVQLDQNLKDFYRKMTFSGKKTS